MKSITPKPKLNDVVERRDFKRMFGKIIEIYNFSVKVEWEDNEKPKTTTEFITNLALVERR